MTILVANKFGQVKLLSRKTVPRKGDSLDLFYSPMPIVKEVIFWPRRELKEKFGFPNHEIEVIVICD